MEKEQFIEYLNSEEGQGLISEQGFSKLSKDSVSAFLEGTEEGKALQFSIGDKTHNNYMKKLEEKGSKVYDGEALKSLREQWRQEDNPALTPEQVRIKELEDQFKSLETEKKLGNNYRALEDLNKDYNLPIELLRIVNKEDFESSKEIFGKIGDIWKGREESIREAVIKELKGESPKPGGGGKADVKDAEMDAFDKAFG